MRGRGRRSYPQRRNRGNTSRREAMLDMGRMNSFVYYAEQIIDEVGERDNVWNAILASIVVKASRQSIEEAQSFIVQKVRNGELPKEAQEPLIQLLNQYSKMR